MEIWIWIVAAIVISLFVLRKQKISFEHYIWILLPIDMYGISVGGATIKPYMIFSFVLLVRILFKRDKTLQFRGTWAIAGLFVTIAVVLVNFLNNDDFSSVKAAFMIVVVYACVIVYISNCGESTFRDVPKAIIAAGIGYGLVFVVGVLLTNMGVVLPGVIASERNVSGFYMEFGNMYQGQLVSYRRLRGFTIDPNTMIGTFALCSTVSVIKIIQSEGKLKEWLSIALSAICVLMSNSRMGIICFLLLTVIAVIVGYKLANVKVKNYILVVSVLLVVVGIPVALMTGVLEKVSKFLYSIYSNRSGLTDDYGRFTIWKDAISILFEKNPILGIGLGQTKLYTVTERACHNTWLEMICGNGLIVGGIFIFYFIFPLINGVLKAVNNKEQHKSILIWSMVLGLLVVMISLISVDNMTYSYLWFGMALLCVITQKNVKEPYLQENV